MNLPSWNKPNLVIVYIPFYIPTCPFFLKNFYVYIYGGYWYAVLFIFCCLDFDDRVVSEKLGGVSSFVCFQEEALELINS